jgi:hypothetical protein
MNSLLTTEALQKALGSSRVVPIDGVPCGGPLDLLRLAVEIKRIQATHHPTAKLEVKEIMEHKTPLRAESMLPFFTQAGRHACISQLLYLGYQVFATPQKTEQDTFFVEREEGELCTFHVLSAEPQKKEGERSYLYTLSRKPLVTPHRQEHYYAFAMREERHFEFVLLRQEELVQKIFGKNQTLATDEIELMFSFSSRGLFGNAQPFDEHLHAFARYFPQKTR